MKKGACSANKLLFFALIVIFMLAVSAISVVTAACGWTHSVSPTVVNENDYYLFNFNIGNVDSTDNITRVIFNINNLPGTFGDPNLNGTSLTAPNSAVLGSETQIYWANTTSDPLILQGENYDFWFNATATTPGINKAFEVGTVWTDGSFCTLENVLITVNGKCIGSTSNFTCGEAVTESCTLDGDLSCSGNGLMIGAENITLDCDSHSITGDGSPSDGINNIGYDYVTVKNCIITGFSNSDLIAPFSAGIRYYDGADYGAIINNTITSISEGISLYSSSNNNITNNIARLNTYQNIMLRTGSNNNTIANNTVTNSATGIYLGSGSGCNYNTIINNNVSYNSYAGISLDSDSNGNIIENNTATYNSNVGIGLWSSSSNNIRLNQIYNNTNYDAFQEGGCSNNNFTLNYWGESLCGAKLSGMSASELVPYYTDAELTVLQNASFCCGETVTTNYTLPADLSCSGTGLTIGADNVMLDCAGHSITGTTGPFGADYGISTNTYYENITVENCRVTNFWGGIFFSDSSTTGSSIINNTAWGNAEGFHMFGHFIEVSGNTAYENMNHGMNFATGGLIGTISGNNISNNFGNGMHFEDPVSADLISDNIMSYNSGIGLFCDFGFDGSGCAFPNIINNTVNNNSNSGISIRTSVATIIANNTVNGNSGAGLAFSNSANGFISGNAFNDNTDRGIKIDGIINYTISGNNLTGNRYGISLSNSYLIDSENNTINLNRIFDNTNEDIENSGFGNNATLNYWGESLCGARLAGISRSELLPYYTDEALTTPSSDLPFCFCDDTITSDTTLTQNYTCFGYGLTIGEDNITLDCNGYTLTGPDSQTAISAYGRTNVTVKNCTITNFYYGIVIDASTYSNITSNTANNNTYGIFLNPGSSGNSITDNTLTGNYDTGIYFNSGSDNIINFNKVYNNTNYDAYQDSSTGNNFTFNYWGGYLCNAKIGGIGLSDLLPYYTDFAMTILDSDPPVCICGSTITENTTLARDYTCAGNGPAIGAADITLDCAGHSITGSGSNKGISIDGFTRVTVKNCTISDFDEGIYVHASSDDTLQNNIVYDNEHSGIHIEGLGAESGHIVINNNLTGNCISSSNCGSIYLSHEDNCLIQGNNVSDNYGHGILLVTSHDNRILSNTILDNYWAGIIITSPVSAELGGYNNVSGNTLVNNNRLGIATKTQNNMFINNTISTDGRGAHLSGIDLRKTGGVASPENNYLSGNDVSGYQYGLDTWNGIMNFTVDGDRYHDNGYGIWLQGIGSAELMPTISNSEIYNNSHGVYLTSSSYANISDTNFTNNPGTEGGGGSGIHVEGGSTAYVTNGRFIDNGEYGIYDVILDHVYWTINSNTLCKNNDVRINGNITFDGGILEAINCSLSMGGSAALELSGNLSSLQLAQASIVANISSDEIDFEDTDSAITLMLGEDVTTTIMISSVIPTTTPSAVLEALKGIEITVDNATEGNLTWALIKIFYDEAELTAANIDESTLKIYYYNKTAADWQLEPNQGVDTVNNYVWANVTHFSLFGAFGTAPIAAAAVTTTKGGGCLTNWTCSEWGKCTKGTQTRTCQKIREVCYAGAKPEETQACSVEGIAGAGAEEQEKTFVILTSKSWWILVSVIAAISIVVLIILKLSKILRYRRYF